MAAPAAAARPFAAARWFLAVLVAAFLPVGQASRLLRGKQSPELIQDGDGQQVEKVNPVTKVVQMLQEMKEQVEADAKEDADIFAKHKCWCENNEKEKKEAIERAKARIEQLEAKIEEGTALAARLAQEIEALEEEIKEDQEALEKATVIREEERADFESEQKDAMECIAALKEAVAVLSKVQLVQKHASPAAPAAKPPAPQPVAAAKQATSDIADALDPFALAQVQRAVDRVTMSLEGSAPARGDARRSGQYRAIMQKDLWDVLGGLSGGLRSVTGLAQEGQAQPAGGVMGAKSYNARSGQIFGILQQMQDTFEANLKAAQKAEVAAEISFQRLRAAKMEEIQVASQAVESKSAQLADTNAMVAQAKEDVVSTREALSADEAFLIDLEEMCATAVSEFDERVATRAEEVKAIAEAIEVLSQDDARDIFSRTVSFLQVGQRRKQPFQIAALQTQARAMTESSAQAATDRLMAVAKKHWGTAAGWQLMELAASARNDGIEKVKDMMDKMIADLKQQEKDEYEKKETCNKDIDANEDAEREKKREQKDLEAQVGALNATVEQLTTDIQDLATQIADAQVTLKAAGESRKAEDQEFQQTVADQRATAEIIGKAVDRLKSFYNKKAALIEVARSAQEPGKASSPRPESGKEYKRHGGGQGVIGALELIIEDAKAAEAQAIKAEQEAQAEYGTLVANTNKFIQAAEDSTAQKTAAKDRAEAEALEAKKSLRMVETALLEIGDQGVALHLSCDWLLRNYQIRWQARSEEIGAIQEAKAILSGADFGL